MADELTVHVDLHLPHDHTPHAHASTSRAGWTITFGSPRQDITVYAHIDQLRELHRRIGEELDRINPAGGG